MTDMTGIPAVTVLVPASSWVPNPNPAVVSPYSPPPGVSHTCPFGTLQGSNEVVTGIPQPAGLPPTDVPSPGINYPYPCTYIFQGTQIIATPPSVTTTKPGATTTRTIVETVAPDITDTRGSEYSTPNLSTGAVSGIGIAAFVLGILLGLVAAGCWLCSRSRPSRHNGMTPNGEERSVMLLSAPPVPPPKDPTTASPSSQAQSSPRVTPISAAAAIPHASSLGHANVLHSLQGANDDQIAKELEFMGDMIEEHVKNNYHLKRVNIDHNMLRESMDGLYLDEAMRDQITALAMEPHTRHVAIRHFLALSIFSALDVHYAHGVSLLPPGVSAFMRSLPCERPEDYSYSTIVLDTWRRASAYLLNSNTDKTTSLSPQEVGNSQIENFHAAVNRFLSHFAHEDSRAVFDQAKNLEGVIYECVVFGYSIFSHPCLWRYTYIQHHQSTSSDLEKTSLVVLPGLEKRTGRGGEVLAHLEVLVNPTIVSA